MTTDLRLGDLRLTDVRMSDLDPRDADTAARIQAVLLPAHAQEAALLRVDGPAPPARSLADLQSSGEQFIGAWCGDQLAGVLSVKHGDDAGQRCIALLVVHPRHQRQGVARRLMATLLQREPQQPHVVSTGARNTPALTLYARCGFNLHRQGTLGAAALPMVQLLRPASQPATLDHAGIAARVPHSGRMCLLHSLLRWGAERIECTALSHADPLNPLRTQGVLLAPNAIEYAAQAMALHGTLSAAPGSAPTPGFLASVRGVRLLVPTLHDVPGALQVAAHKQAGDERQAAYAFTLHDDTGRLLVDGRATVILNALP